MADNLYSRSLRSFPSIVLLLALGFAEGCGGKADASAGQRSASGGSGGQGPAPHLGECEELCARAAEAGCATGDSACTLTCATVTGFSSCQKQIQAWLDCTESANISCDENGLVTFEGCDGQLSAALTCAAMTPPPKPVRESCTDYCDQIEASGCASALPFGECRQGCGLAGTVISTCQSSFVQYVDCVVKSGGTCDESGQLNASVCTAQQLVYLGCVMSAVGQAAITGAGGAPSQ